MRHLLEVDSVLKYFDKTMILSDVYLKCETGNVIGLLGRNGTGKSTLLKIIYGILSAENKFVRIDGKIRSKAFQYHKDISYLSQDDFIPKYLKVSKAIRLFLSKELRLAFNEDPFIKKMHDKKISHLSSGEIKYLEIKLILSNQSKFVLLDEPFNGVAPIMMDQIVELILDNSKGKGIILTDHQYKNVLKVSTDIYLIKDCSLKKLKSQDELISRGYLREGML